MKKQVQLKHQLFLHSKVWLMVAILSVQVAHLALEHPGGLDRGHPCGDVPALVAPNEVEGQGGTVFVHRPDLAVGDQAQLYQRLEAVADAQHQPVPVLQ